MSIFINKSCKECPKNKREFIVYQKGYCDGLEIIQNNFKKIIGKLYWRRY